MSDRTCAVTGCERPVRTRGWCNMHHLRVLRTGDPGPAGFLPKGPRLRPAPERFWAQVEKTETCWLWTGRVNNRGYGDFMVCSATGERALAHRFAYELLVGPIPEGLDLDHKCHHRRCVRPRDLQPVSRTLNNENRGHVNRNSTTGVRGVSFVQSRGLFEAYAMHDRHKYHGGRFATIGEAEIAAIALRNRLMTNNLLDRATA